MNGVVSNFDRVVKTGKLMLRFGITDSMTFCTNNKTHCSKCRTMCQSYFNLRHPVVCFFIVSMVTKQSYKNNQTPWSTDWLKLKLDSDWSISSVNLSSACYAMRTVTALLKWKI